MTAVCRHSGRFGTADASCGGIGFRVSPMDIKCGSLFCYDMFFDLTALVMDFRIRSKDRMRSENSRHGMFALIFF